MKFKDGNFYAVERVSPRREKTPEGYLICKDVPISRVGEFEYTALEMGGAVKGKGGKVIMTRTPEELFRPETKGSPSSSVTIDSQIRRTSTRSASVMCRTFGKGKASFQASSWRTCFSTVSEASTSWSAVSLKKFPVATTHEPLTTVTVGDIRRASWETTLPWSKKPAAARLAKLEMAQ